MRWIRLDISWSESEWLTVLSAEARLAWVELLCYVKASGAAGRAKALVPERFARRIYVGEESVRQMLMAAERHGALAIVEGDWLIVKWAQFQGDETNAERQARFRENRKAEKRNGSNALLTPVTVTETLTETELVVVDNKGGAGGSEQPPKSPARAAPFVHPTPEDVALYFVVLGMPKSEAGRYWDHYESKGRPWKVGRERMKDWKAAARNWHRRWAENQSPSNGKPKVHNIPTAEELELVNR